MDKCGLSYLKWRVYISPEETTSKQGAPDADSRQRAVRLYEWSGRDSGKRGVKFLLITTNNLG